MSNVLNVLVENLNEVFKENDDKILNDTIKWAFEMKEKIREFRKGDGTVRKNYFEECKKLQDECGSKKWFDVIYKAYNDELLVEKVKEFHNDVIKKRNKNIASKLEERNFHNVSKFLKDVNSRVSKEPKVIQKEKNKFVINYSDNNEIVVYFSFYDNKFQECSFSYHFPLNNAYGFSTTAGYFIKPNDKSFTNLPNYNNWINDINHHIKNAEISAQIQPIKYKAEIVL